MADDETQFKAQWPTMVSEGPVLRQNDEPGAHSNPQRVIMTQSPGETDMACDELGGMATALR